MERYRFFGKEIKDKTTGKKRFSSVYYPDFPYKDSDIYVYSKSSDKLDILADKYYNDQRYWWVIARVNNLGKGTFDIPPGIRLRIPYPINELVLVEIRDNLNLF